MHGVGDVELVERGMPEDHDALTMGGTRALADATRKRSRRGRTAHIDVESSAWQSYDAPEQTAYRALATWPVEPALDEDIDEDITDCTEDRQVARRMAKLREVIDPDYASPAHPVIEQQLAKAGTRLATPNELWP